MDGTESPVPIEAAFYGVNIEDENEKAACISWHSGKVIGNIHEQEDAK